MRQVIVKKSLHYLRLLAELLSRKILVVLPNSVLGIIGSRGYTQWIPRIKEVQYIGWLYQSDLKIHVRNDYTVERVAANRFLDSGDVAVGLRQLNMQGLVALDIGANVGSISLLMANQGASKIHALEPGPLISRLRDNVELNGLGDRIKTYNIGLAAADGHMLWAEDQNNLGNAHLVSADTQLNLMEANTVFVAEAMQKVPTCRLSYFVENEVEGPVDLIKVDVEGMEWEVLQSGLDVLTHHRPVVVAETHRVASDMMGYDCLTPMFQFFYDLGYKTYKINSDGDLQEFIYPNFSLDTFFLPDEISSYLK